VSPQGWDGAEAWIFLSIGDAAGQAGRNGRASLAEVIGTADANNHAIPNLDEFNSSVGHLVGAGLITATPDVYSLTHSGRALYRQINSGKRGHIVRFVETATAWRERAPSQARRVSWAIDEGQLGAAVEEYRRWFGDAMRRLDDREKGRG